eukprot:CAMPEP_0118645790 /NCGR_PEP_ID=MMETSP0785-20121206/7695_1 /TAXON_ID=91992 /ORGANISM="Bolidomonas pacifica, Strain CCMP 1866" /LENGTH=434 /DNA_ID=CAMNT_0006537709 /DNA_START=29 /DNA_END=1333 /DNA_ORIENTATION=+
MPNNLRPLLLILSIFLFPNVDIVSASRDYWYPDITEKNWTRWSSIMGTWTASGNYKVGAYSVEVNAIAHMTCDSLGNYRRTYCNATCDAIEDNEVCVGTRFDTHWTPSGPTFEFECADIASNSTKVEGGEAAMYMSFGSSFISSGDSHVANTGGFVGPYSVLLPDTDEEADETGDKSVTYLRYVKSLSSDLLKQPLNYNITTDDGSFERMFGQLALNNTIDIQAQSSDVDPYADYVGKDCSHGNIQNKLVLPLIEFRDNGDGQAPGVHFKYQLLVDIQQTQPESTRALLKMLFDRLSSESDQPVSGPYCSNGATYGYLFDLTFDSESNDKRATFVSGCLEGHDCIPTHLQGCQECNNAQVYEEPVTTINLEITLYLAIAVCVLLLVLSFMSCYICRVKSQFKKERTEMTALMSDHITGGEAGSLEGGSYEKLES